MTTTYARFLITLALAIAIIFILGILYARAQQVFYGDPYDDARAAQWGLPPPVPLPPPPVAAYAPAPPPPLGWIYGPYTVCADPPACRGIFVNVGADGLNFRAVPNGPVLGALVNGVPVIPLGPREGNWILVGVPCFLIQTFTWSITSGVPLSVCAL